MKYRYSELSNLTKDTLIYDLPTYLDTDHRKIRMVVEPHRDETYQCRITWTNPGSKLDRSTLLSIASQLGADAWNIQTAIDILPLGDRNGYWVEFLSNEVPSFIIERKN